MSIAAMSGRRVFAAVNKTKTAKNTQAWEVSNEIRYGFGTVDLCVQPDERARLRAG
jgi:hypothetical protein